jgi:hypothetical protein
LVKTHQPIKPHHKKGMIKKFSKIFSKGIKLTKNYYMTRIYSVVPPVTDIKENVK